MDVITSLNSKFSLLSLSYCHHGHHQMTEFWNYYRTGVIKSILLFQAKFLDFISYIDPYYY